MQQHSPFSFDLAAAKPTVQLPGGTITEADHKSFPVLKGLSIFRLTLEPGALRIPHWHPDTDEMQYVLSGQCRIGLISTAKDNGPGEEHTFDLKEGMIGYIPRGWFHYILNTGSEPATMLIIFDSENPDDVDISWAFRITPPNLLRQVFGIDFQGIDTDQIWISPADGAPGSPDAGTA